MRFLDKYIIFSSVFALFSEDFSFNYIIDIKLFYAILIINIILLQLKGGLKIHKNIALIIGFIIIHGIIASIIYKETITVLIAQVLGISITSIFYYNFLRKYGLKTTFDVYLKLAFYIALLAIPMFYLRINVFLEGDRLNGILSEPAHYAAIMLPALYVFLREKKHLKFGIILLTIILSKSSMGYIGILLIITLPLLKVKYLLKYLPPVLLVVGLGFFYISSKWDDSAVYEHSNALVRRVKQTYESYNAAFDGDFRQDTNLSSYAVLSNTYIAKESFKDNPFGTGIGSYPKQYEKYYPQLNPPSYLLELKFSKINKLDANSLFLRLLVDLGIFGIVFVVFFAFKTYRLFKKDEKVIQQSTFFYLIVKLIREGHYFPPEFYFFLLIFLKDFNEDVDTRKNLIN